MRCGAAPIEYTGGGEQEGAGADAGHPPRNAGRLAQPTQRAMRIGGNVVPAAFESGQGEHRADMAFACRLFQ